MNKLPSLFHPRKKNYNMNYYEVLVDLGNKIDMLSDRVNQLEDTVYGVIDATRNQKKLNNPGVKFISQHPIYIDDAKVRNK